jgi:hypothetical protein
MFTNYSRCWEEYAIRSGRGCEVRPAPAYGPPTYGAYGRIGRIGLGYQHGLKKCLAAALHHRSTQQLNCVYQQSTSTTPPPTGYLAASPFCRRQSHYAVMTPSLLSHHHQLTTIFQNPVKTLTCSVSRCSLLQAMKPPAIRTVSAAL